MTIERSGVTRERAESITEALKVDEPGDIYGNWEKDKKQSPQGVPPGIYRTFAFKSKRAADQGFRFEVVTVRANSANAWEVYSYDISPITTPS